MREWQPKEDSSNADILAGNCDFDKVDCASSLASTVDLDDSGFNNCKKVHGNTSVFSTDSDDNIFRKSSGKMRSHPVLSTVKSLINIAEQMNVPPSENDREDIFGRFVASEMKVLAENPLLYLQTKQAILEILTSAHFELINPEEQDL